MIVKIDLGLYEHLKREGWDDQGAAIIATQSADVQGAWMNTWNDTERLAFLDSMRANPHYAMTGDYLTRWIDGPPNLASVGTVGADAGQGLKVALVVGAVVGAAWFFTRGENSAA